MSKIRWWEKPSGHSVVLDYNGKIHKIAVSSLHFSFLMTTLCGISFSSFLQVKSILHAK